ncbi:hypothetical protein G7B40_007525 [Aetokthonos hydrillicola Thurmond2011]|uniref:Uncharacterized protein n=1 Tax=Aetokthonos hydrillicola Thurmond2011 TaxID=2712845 RepID=A0AAP5I463_9CYAN|nr:hypothetical protein [Aetokthonos hydrillicola]MBO3460644.1 hypothetical protein [Aetokthonos hydrillicola CCALA 1050]MBW4587774.1 hypothetical protein [Aetokthonos hydrillicola CCALA 1050]MDR9894421.1 hypothetical protein [Aetokthonos hydrillicola Thurmond2011]
MADRIVPREDISDIRRYLKDIGPVVVDVKQRVDSVDDRLTKFQGDFKELRKIINDFIEKDIKDKQLQLAQTRLVTVRQELEQKFGFYNELRRRTTGILQAADLSLVKRETIANTTDELMLSAPKYWLAPVLVATSSWLLDNKELADRAVAEALQRDDEKASLFFALIMRRAKRSQAYQIWLDRYFGMQDPETLDRQMIVVLNALVNGVFGIETYSKCLTRIETWLNELSEKAGYIDQQRQRWEDALRSKIAPLSDEIYPYLRKYSPTWSKLSEVLREAKGHEDIFNYFKGVFEGEITRLAKFEDEVDRLLTSLATKFDDEELPLISEERLQSLIIKHGGHTDRAQQQYDMEKSAFEDKVTFTQILSNAAITPELTETSLATQRFAIALSHEWIVSAHQDFTAKNRLKVPQTIELSIDDWKGSSTDGSNELQLVSDVESHYEKRKQDALSKVKINPLVWAYLVIGTLLFFPALSSKNFFMMLVGAGGGVSFFVAKKQTEATKKKIENDYRTFNANTQQVLRATLAEIVDWRREYLSCDQRETKVTELLEGITPEEYILNPHGSSRRLFMK